jgi:DNA-binding transcriptional ArsR family regulator
VTTATVFQALGEPRRLQILDLLRDGERPVGELVEELGVSQPAVSKHLRILKAAGLVDVRADAQRRLYRVRTEPLVELDEWLAAYRRMWSTHLDRLADHLERRRTT